MSKWALNLSKIKYKLIESTTFFKSECVCCLYLFACSVSGELDSLNERTAYVFPRLFFYFSCVWMHASMLNAQRDTKEGCDCFDLMPNVSYKDEKPLRIYICVHFGMVLWQMCLACAIHTEIKPDFCVPKMLCYNVIFALKLVI